MSNEIGGIEEKLDAGVIAKVGDIQAPLLSSQGSFGSDVNCLAYSGEETKEAVLIVDMIDIFVNGRYGSEAAKSVVEPNRRLLEAARQTGRAVYFLCDAHKPGDREFEYWGEHALDGSEEARIIPELSPLPGERVIGKQSYSGFRGTGLADELRARGVKKLYVPGIATHICVNDNVADAYYEGFDVVLVADATQSFAKDYHTAGMDFMKQKYSKDIRTVDEIVTGWKAGGAK